jgi:hypothetical protein
MVTLHYYNHLICKYVPGNKFSKVSQIFYLTCCSLQELHTHCQAKSDYGPSGERDPQLHEELWLLQLGTETGEK